jgi:hypothetical protein
VPAAPYIALTDKAWFDFLAARADRGVVDEVNFWSPASSDPLKTLHPGEPVFFRLKKPWHAVAGYGLFAHFSVLDLDVAWDCFGWKNGDPDKLRFLTRIGGYRGIDLLHPKARREHLGCTILRSAHFWPEERWLPWAEAQGWQVNIVRGKSERDSARALRLLAEMDADQQLIPDDLSERPFEPFDVDERAFVLRSQATREGQGAFRTRVLDAYGRRCAITGEHTEPSSTPLTSSRTEARAATTCRTACCSRRSSTPSSTSVTSASRPSTKSLCLLLSSATGITESGITHSTTASSRWSRTEEICCRARRPWSGTLRTCFDAPHELEAP